VAVERLRERIEDFMRRYGRVLVVVVAVLLALLVLRRLRVLASLVPIGALLGAVVVVAMAVTSVGLLQAPTYQATARVLVDPAQGTGHGKIQLIPNAPAPETLRALTQTMIRAIDNRPAAEEVIQRLGLRIESAELLDNLTAEQVEGTQFIRLSYEDTDPERATQIVNTVGEVSSELISERSAAGSNLTATVWDKAAVPETPVSPRPFRNGLVTLVVGWTLIGCLAVLVHRTT